VGDKWVRAYHVRGNGGKLPPLGPRGGIFPSLGGELNLIKLVSQLPNTKNSKDKTGQHHLRSKIRGPFDKHALHIYLVSICNVWAVLIFCAKTRIKPWARERNEQVGQLPYHLWD